MPDNTEPLVLINLFSMPPEMVERFIAGWEANIATATAAPGFRGTRLHRSLDPDADYPVVNIARWDSIEAWQRTVDQHFSTPRSGLGAAPGESRPVAHPNLYTVVHVTPDPVPPPAPFNDPLIGVQTDRGPGGAGQR